MAAATSEGCTQLCQVSWQATDGKFEIRNETINGLLHSVVFARGFDKFFILINGRVEAVVHSTLPVSHGQLCEQREAGILMLWGITEGGHIYCMPLWSPKEFLKTRQTTQPEVNRPDAPTENLCIFEDLLGNESERSCPSSPRILTISEDHLLLQTLPVQGLLVLSDCLLLLLPFPGGGHSLAFFPLTYHLQTGKFKLDLLQKKTFHLPENSEIVNRDNDKTKVECDVTKCYMLHCVYTEGTQYYLDYPKGKQSSVLGKELYNSLFGFSMNLSNARIVLVGLPSGKIYSVPLVSAIPESSQQPTVLYDIQKPVIGIYSISSMTKKTKKTDSKICGNDCLCFIGSVGKGTIIKSCSVKDKENSLPWSSTEFQITGPVLDTAMSSRGTLFHSNGQNIYSTDVSCLLSDSAQSSPTSLFHITAPVVALELRDSDEASESLQLLVVTSQGHVMEFNLSIKAEQPSSYPGLANSQQIRNLLNGIANTSENLDQINRSLVQKDCILGQLSLAGYASALSTNQQKPGVLQSKPPLEVNLTVQSQDVGPEVHYILDVCLTNNSPVKLSHEWNLVVSIATEQESTDHSQNSTTVQVSSLSPGQFQRFPFPLTQQHLKSIPFTVQCSLVYTCTGKMEHKETLLPSVDATPSLAIPLSVSIIDILFFLKALPLDKPLMINPRVLGGCDDRDIVTSLYELASQKPFGSAYLDKHGGSETIPQPWSTRAVIHVSKQHARDILQSTNDRIEVALLAYLLENSPIKPGPQQAHLRAESIGGHQVSVTVERTQDRLAERDDGFQVVLQTSAVQLMCQLRSAILSRLNAPGTMGNQSLSSKAVRAQLSHYKDIQSEVESLQTAAELQSATPAQLVDQTLKLYQRLRSLQILY